MHGELQCGASPDRVFAVLTDLPTTAGCIPGFRMSHGTEATVAGTLALRAEEASRRWAGTASLLQTDRSARSLRLRLDADDGGAGPPSSHVRAEVCADGAGSTILLDVLDPDGDHIDAPLPAEVMAAFIGQLASNIEAAACAAAPPEAPAPHTPSAPATAPQPPVADHVAAEGGEEGGEDARQPLDARLAAVTIVLCLLIGWLVGRRRRTS